ncbi:hypothetical protein HDU97_009881, partial [Phlyctochytrium planicorne]
MMTIELIKYLALYHALALWATTDINAVLGMFAVSSFSLIALALIFFSRFHLIGAPTRVADQEASLIPATVDGLQGLWRMFTAWMIETSPVCRWVCLPPSCVIKDAKLEGSVDQAKTVIPGQPPTQVNVRDVPKVFEGSDAQIREVNAFLANKEVPSKRARKRQLPHLVRLIDGHHRQNVKTKLEAISRESARNEVKVELFQAASKRAWNAPK